MQCRALVFVVCGSDRRRVAIKGEATRGAQKRKARRSTAKISEMPTLRLSSFPRRSLSMRFLARQSVSSKTTVDELESRQRKLSVRNSVAAASLQTRRFLF